MTTTGTTVKNAFLDAASPVSAVTNTQKETDKTQNFSDVLGKTAQKFVKADQTTNQTVMGNANSKSQQPKKTTFKESKNAESAKDDKNAANASAPVEEEKVETKEETEAKPVIWTTPEPVDEMTAEEIANALEQIIEQIKKILGITDEELLSGMEDLGIQPIDLLNTDNIAQLVTAIAGEDSAISLIANEDLYTALQDITDMIDTQVSSLLESTGLSDEELDAVLQKLREIEDSNPDQQLPKTEMAPLEEQNETAVAETLETMEEQPVIIKEVNTQSNDDKATKQDDKLSENQQEDVTGMETKTQVQNVEKDSKDSDNKDAKHFGQDNAAQNFQNNLNEISDTAVAEDVVKYTSESTESIMRQLADMVKIVKNENLTEMELQLHPASLGTVNVSLTTKGGVVTAEFTTQNEAVKAAIEAQASQLKANLEEQGVKIEAIEVSVESHQMERDLEKDGNQQQRQSQEQEAGRIQGIRRGKSSINLRAFADGEELEGEMQGADDATRIAMEIMAANGNTMDLLA